MLQSIDEAPGSGARKQLFPCESNAVFVPAPQPALGMSQEGWLLFGRQGTLFAQRFEPLKLEPKGEALPLAEHIDSTWSTALSAFSASETGALVFSSDAGAHGGRLGWISRDGKPSSLALPPGPYAQPRLSPDGTRLVFSLADSSGSSDLWQTDLVNGVNSRFTFDPAPDIFPVWSPDGKQIAFGSVREGARLFLKASTGAGEEEAVSEPMLATAIYDWSRDGRYLLYLNTGASTGPDLWVFDLKERKPSPFLQTPFTESQGQFSPNGRWVAYSSDESGRYAIYVRSFSGPSKFQISADGGAQARWRGDGKELYYIAPGGKMMAVAVNPAADSLQPEAPRILFETRALATAVGSGPQGYPYDVTRDGQRFLILDRGRRDSAVDTYHQLAGGTDEMTTYALCTRSVRTRAARVQLEVEAAVHPPVRIESGC
jgi:hypothetical protein